MDSATALQSRLIGAIFVEKQLITAEQLTRALQLQEDTGERLGEIVVSEFGVSRLELASVLAEQWAELESPTQGRVADTANLLEEIEPLTPGEAQIRRPIGEIFVELGFISSEQLNAALEVQRETGSRIGEILVEQGSLSRLDLASALAEQWSAFQKLRPPAPVVDPMPWQNGVPVPLPSANTVPPDHSAPVAALEDKVRLLESAQHANPSHEDLHRTTAELQASLDALEQRLEARVSSPNDPSIAEAIAVLTARVEALAGNSLEGELAAVRAELDRLKERPDTDEALAALQSSVARLEARPDRADEITELRNDLIALGARLEGLADTGELADRLDAVAGQAEIAQTGIVDLSRRLEELGALAGKVEEIEARTPDTDVVNASFLDPTPRLDELAARVDELTRSTIAGDVAALAQRISSLETVDRAGSQSVERLGAEIEALAGRFAEVAPAQPDLGAIDEIRSRVEEVEAAIAKDDSVSALEARLDALDGRIAAATPTAELREEMRRVAESSATERESLAEALFARVEAITQTVPRVDELAELRARVDELASRPIDSEALQTRIEAVAERLGGLDALEGVITEMRNSLDQLEAVRVGDALATGVRLATLEENVSALAALADRLRDQLTSDLGGSADALAERLDGAEGRLGLIEELKERLVALSSDLERRPDAAVLEALAFELRQEMGSLAERPLFDDPSERIEELSRSVEQSHNRTREVAAALQQQIGDVGRALAGRADDLASRMDTFVGRDEAAEQEARIRAGLEAQQSETTALRAQVDELQRTSAGRVAWEARIESLLEERLAELSTRVTAEVDEVRAEAAATATELRGEQSSLATRFGELLELRTADVDTARAATERLAEQVAALAALRQDDADAARSAAADLSARLETLGESLRAEAAASHRDAAAVRNELEGISGSVADSRALVDGVGAQVKALREQRADDLAAAEIAGAELAARLDDHAVRSAAAAFEVEQALRHELGGVAARLEERDAQGIEAREALRIELEQVASSVGWRLERIEASLSGDATAELRSAVTALEGRLAEQVALGEEQVRATERALRKGLASLGEKLADTESTYVDAGNALRRSIERLGAAVVEADARMMDGIPTAASEGCVAFAPTSAGYRLVAIAGAPPELGSTIELDDCDGPLVVTRYGRSPLPLDGRPCAYLDRA